MENPSVLQFEIVKNVTLPFVIIPNDGSPFYLKFDTAIKADDSTFSERVRKSKNDENGNKEPMKLANVTNLQTGEIGRLVIHSVLESTLTEAYPNESYVGKYFELKKSKASGKRYFSFNIVEIKLKSSPDSGNQTQGAAKTTTKK